MFGHGTFIYYPQEAAKKHGSYKNAAKHMKAQGMQHAWLRVHGSKGNWHTEQNKALIGALRAEDIQVFGWGWCDGTDVDRNIENVRRALATFDLDGYVADVEPDEPNVNWTKTGLRNFAKAVRELLGPKPFVLSSYGFLPYHQPDLIAQADPYVDAFAPQVYWFNYPNKKMRSHPGATGTYKLDNAASYADICLDVWAHVVTKPLILTGQCYWGEAPQWKQKDAETKLAEFLEGFTRWDALAGLNWWHFAGDDTMSDKMTAMIAAAHLDTRLAAVAAVSAGNASTPQALTSASYETLIVSGDGLRLRTHPDSNDEDTVIAILDLSQEVTKLGEGSKVGWTRIAVEDKDRIVEGEAFSKFLRPPEPPKVEALVRECVDEWIRFDRGNGPENASPYRAYVGEMWAEAGYPNWDGTTNQPWSAAFISWVLKNADYTDFRFSARHAIYVQQAIMRREATIDGPYWGFRLHEHKPRLGDMVCIDRSNLGVDYDYAEDHDSYPSHCDIVVQVRPDSVRTIGGNTGHGEFGHSGSVAMKTFPLDADGYMRPLRGVFAVLRNNFAGSN